MTFCTASCILKSCRFLCVCLCCLELLNTLCFTIICLQLALLLAPLGLVRRPHLGVSPPRRSSLRSVARRLVFARHPRTNARVLTQEFHVRTRFSHFITRFLCYNQLLLRQQTLFDVEPNKTFPVKRQIICMIMTYKSVLICIYLVFFVNTDKFVSQLLEHFLVLPIFFFVIVKKNVC